ncbi:MAG: ABC transporter substrate-binding protein [Rhodospirillales bacterium]|nr:ABC transporter substrate-binding protein [Rhodospirillales bacterium]MDE2198413.1 ABC transporter substrate-binding protein [Rhodospirillales bacterium]MDE2574847.1 ABC transporter substrate-binding protein [Rhodospirillales bacterium]
MNISRRTLLGTAAAVATVPAISRRARAASTIKIGVLNDMSGPYRDTSGPTSLICAKQAALEFGNKGFDVEILSADHQNKPDVGAAIARQWYDRDGVDLVLDVPNSAVGLAVSAVSKEKNKAYVNCGAGSSALTGTQCSPAMIHYVYDTYMLGKSTGGATVRAGGDTWYFLTADYAFGHQLQDDATRFIVAEKGKILGSSAYPFPNTTDYSSFLLQAQSTGAKVLGLCNAGSDTVNSIKQAHEFGLKMKIAALLMFVTDVHALGLGTAGGLMLSESFYWDLNDRTRAFTNRVKSKTPNNWPNMAHAGNYSATLHFLKAVADMGVAEAKKSGIGIINRMKKMPVDDDCYQGNIREDGRALFPSHLFQVKTPAQSKGPWDYYNLISTTSGPDSYRPLADDHCSFIKS